MNLVSIYSRPDRCKILFDLLAERTSDESISHHEMPSWDEHVKFVESKPYEAWYFILNERVLGACYLTKRDEIGVHVFREHQGNGYGTHSVSLLMKLHGSRRYLANINPKNERSAAMFRKLGFRLLQHTYASLTPFASSETSSAQSRNIRAHPFA